MGDLSTPDSVQKLQTALHAKAKAEPGYRFYALYDKISREDILAHAYAQCRSNKGAPGVDRQDFEDIEAYGVERWLGELALALRQETYRPDPIRRVFIPKANGKLRPLGISTLRDRVCMTAAMLVLEPNFADLPSELYAYRPGRNAQQAVVEVEELLFRGHPDVVDADLADYFGSIPHAELLKSVSRRIVDRRVLPLIRMWLDCPVEETDDRGRRTRTTEARDKRRGIPQVSAMQCRHHPLGDDCPLAVVGVELACEGEPARQERTYPHRALGPGLDHARHGWPRHVELVDRIDERLATRNVDFGRRKGMVLERQRIGQQVLGASNARWAANRNVSAVWMQRLVGTA